MEEKEKHHFLPPLSVTKLLIRNQAKVSLSASDKQLVAVQQSCLPSRKISVATVDGEVGSSKISY